MNYIASASNNSEDLIGSESDKLLGSSTDGHLNKMETAQQIDTREIDKSSSDVK